MKLKAFSRKEYASSFNRLMKKNCCLVSLNKPYTSLKTKPLLVIDGITSSIAEVQADHNTVYTNPDIISLNLAIAKACFNMNIDTIIIDSLSDLIMREKPREVKRFVKYLKNKTSYLEIDCIFTCIREDTPNIGTWRARIERLKK